LVASIKVTQVDFFGFKFSFTAGLLFFPVSYLIGDLLTEVYGYAKSRQVIWSGFAALLFANLVAQAMILLPPAPGWELQAAYEAVFGIGLQVSVASMIAFFCGEFCNSFVIAKLKILLKGKYQGIRIISSTMVGELVDTLIFYPVAFLGNPNFPPRLILEIMIVNYLIKVLWEIIAYPMTRKIIKTLKKQEQEDYYDYQTNFSPFHLG
jgi:uncharacterized integral membrane protein (TIGR00697 family)